MKLSHSRPRNVNRERGLTALTAVGSGALLGITFSDNKIMFWVALVWMQVLLAMWAAERRAAETKDKP
jgi:hypothetical protein